MAEEPWGYKVTVVAYAEGPIENADKIAKALEASARQAQYVGTMIDEVKTAPREQGA